MKYPLAGSFLAYVIGAQVIKAARVFRRGARECLEAARLSEKLRVFALMRASSTR